MSNNTILYSIIIPHKNCVDLLCRCINSIPQREDIEIIAVDDSSDNQSEVLKAMESLNRNNLQVLLTSEAKGGGYARNEGLKIAKGKWLLFSDADDYFSDSAFEVFDLYANSSLDIIFFKHIGIICETGEIVPRSEYRNEIIENYLRDKNSVTESFLRYNNAVPWAKMVRHSLVKEHNIVFEEVPASNDTMFSTQIGHFANAVTADKRCVYYATVRRGSITHTKSKERYFSDYCVYVRRNSFLAEAGHKECSTHLLSLVINSLVSYGPKELLKYLKYARTYNVNVFYGEGGFIKGLGRRIRKYFAKDEMMVTK